MRNRSILILVVIFFALGAATSPVPTRAADSYYSIAINWDTGTCDSTGFTITGMLTVFGNTYATLYERFVYNGVTYLTLQTPLEPGENAKYPIFLSLTLGSHTIPASGDPYAIHFDLDIVDNATGKYYGTSLNTLTCSGGVFTGVSVWVPATQPFAGPPIPGGYALRTIICDVAVFDAPGGNPVGDNKIKAGQTFYVSPVTQKAADGEPWSQVFVGGWSAPWIPTRCIGG